MGCPGSLNRVEWRDGVLLVKEMERENNYRVLGWESSDPRDGLYEVLQKNERVSCKRFLEGEFGKRMYLTGVVPKEVGRGAPARLSFKK